MGSFPHDFTVNATGLTMNTSYNYRGYVISNGVTTYGENKTFSTSDLVPPTIRTDDGLKVGTTTVVMWSTLLTKGSHPISEYGICWSTSANPTTSNSKRSYNGDVNAFPRQFDAEATNLSPATTYHYRGYVIMNGTTTYGENKTFTTGSNPPSITTGEVFNITGRGTVFTGTINSQGSFPISEMGIVYGATENPTTSHTKLSKSGSGIAYPHSFDFLAPGGLGGSAAIYFRAYAISNGNTYYGSSKLARAVPPTLGTGNSTRSSNTFTLRGSLNTKGTLNFREYGIVWLIGTRTPTTSNNKLTLSGNPATPHNFTRTLELGQIGSCRTVTYRAYAITTDGSVYYAPTTAQFNTGGCIN